jgi:hypothetical protein
MPPQKLEMLWLTKEIGLIRGQQIDRSLQLQRRLAAHEQAKVLAVVLYTAGVQPLRKPSAHERLLRVRECDSGRLEDEALKLPELSVGDSNHSRRFAGTHALRFHHHLP